MKIRYSFEQEPLGTAGPIAMVGGMQENFLVWNEDVLTMLDDQVRLVVQAVRSALRSGQT